MVSESKNFLKSDVAKDMAGEFASDLTKNVVGGIAGD